MKKLSGLKLVNVLIFINILYYALTTLVANLVGGGDRNNSLILYIFGADVPTLVLNGEFWRITAASFLHGGLFHIIFNMYSLMILGTYIESFYGSKKLFTIYILTAVGGSLFSVINAISAVWYTNGAENPLSFSIGASAAIFGMLGVLIGNRMKKSPFETELDIDENQLYMIAAYNLIIGFGINVTGLGSVSINNWAHIGGLVFGILIGLLFQTKYNFNKSNIITSIEKILFYLVILIVTYSLITQIINVYSTFFIY